MEPNSTPNFGALLYTDIIGQIIKDALEVCNITVRLFDMELFLSIGEIAMSTPSYQFPMTIEMFINKLKFAFESRELLAVTNPLPEPSISYCIGWNDIMGLMNRHGFNNGSPGDNPNVAGMRTSFQALMLLKLRSFGEISYLHDSIAASIVHAGVAEAFGKSLEKTMTLHVKDLTAGRLPLTTSSTVGTHSINSDHLAREIRNLSRDLDLQGVISFPDIEQHARTIIQPKLDSNNELIRSVELLKVDIAISNSLITSDNQQGR